MQSDEEDEPSQQEKTAIKLRKGSENSHRTVGK
jgi:hypothetical protein